jgi:hypothetical protein
MFRSIRSIRPVLFLATFILILLIAGDRTGLAASDQDRVRITAAANVTLRALPASTAPVVTQVPLGTELFDAGLSGLDRTWIRLKLSDGREGWVLSNLTRQFDRQWPWPAYDDIIADRLGRKGDGFPALTELVTFIERVAPEYTDPDGRARIEFARLRAISSAANAIAFGAGSREPFASWLKARKSEVVYDEPGGRWMLMPTAIWDAHARMDSATIGERVAWFAVNNGLGGECEGYLACYFDRRNRLQGEYLRRHPYGEHAAEAVGVLQETADEVASKPKPSEAFMFDRGTDCRDVTMSLDALTSAVKGTRVSARDATLSSLAALRRLCQ